MDYVLGRQAGDVRTGSADELPFHYGRSLAIPGHRPGNKFTACAAAKHQNVILFCFAHANRLPSAVGDDITPHALQVDFTWKVTPVTPPPRLRFISAPDGFPLIRAVCPFSTRMKPHTVGERLMVDDDRRREIVPRVRVGLPVTRQ